MRVVVERNWARNLTYSAAVVHPRSVDELRAAVTGSRRVHALGTRHSFTPCGDAEGAIVVLDRMPLELEVAEDRRTATVGAQVRLGDLGRLLEGHGLAIANLPSLPHISLGGAIATPTHGSGDALPMLADLVTGLEVVRADGRVERVEGPDLAAETMALGALGVVLSVSLRVEPAFSITQTSFADLPWDAVVHDLDAVLAAAYSVSLFTRHDGTVQGALVKSKDGRGSLAPFGARPDRTDPAEIGADVKHTALNEPGPTWDRLPHFRLAATPSVGEELQSEWFVPRAHAVAALEALRGMADALDPALHVSELRSVARDDHHLSPAGGEDVLAIGFTWRDLPELVLPLLPRVEERLLPLGGRPHWAKLFAVGPEVLAERYPRWDDWRRRRDLVDADRRFGNPFVDGLLDA